MKKLGNGSKRIWLISGQHSGETINSWILEGFVKDYWRENLVYLKNSPFL